MNLFRQAHPAIAGNCRSKFEHLALLFALLITLLVTGCSLGEPDDDDDGIFGTGATLRGTFNETELASNNTVNVRSSDGQRASLQYSANGEYSIDQLPGIGPWLLRVELNQDRSLFGIAYDNGTRNINTFSDVSLRRWFALEGMDVDQVFNAPGQIDRLPSSIEYDASVTSIFVLIDLVTASYDVSGDDVISTRYVTNDTGIDAFLRRNSVILEDGLITFQVTDPDTEIQSETATPVDISANLSDSNSPPTMPGSIRAVASENDEIILAWEPSVDDVAVIGYVVVRDETLLGTTPFPQFIDSNVEGDISYRYVIVAIDGAGNSSDPSAPVVGSLNPEVDTVAPPAPTQLSQISASNTVVRLAWNASPAPDVATYRVFRSELTTASVPIQNVATNRSTDTNIRLDETYCYQVTAIDGSNNESERSNEFCTSADGGVSMETPVIVPTPGDAEIVGDWTVVDADSLNCSSTLTNSDLTVGRLEISNACYTVPETLEIGAGTTLQLGQGAVLRFSSDASLVVSNGSLTALGTRANPVIFTGFEDSPGSWGGIVFSSNSTDNTLDGAVVQYGGGGDAAAAIETGFDGARLRILNTLIRRNGRLALSLNSALTRIDAFTGNRLQENEDVGRVVATAASALSGNNEFIDNTVNELTINFRVIDNADVVIPGLDIVISWGGIELTSGSVEIEPGANIEMVGASLISVNGEFNAVGTADAPIALRARSQSSGSWDGLLLFGSGDKNIEHVNIIGAGLAGDTGAIDIDCNQGVPFDVNISNTFISGSDGWGIFAEGSACTVNIDSSVTFSNIALGNINVP